MNRRTRIHQIRKAVKENKLGLILANPLNAMLFAFLALRSLALRLIPRLTKMYFIRKTITGDAVKIAEANYEFKIINEYSAELSEFVLNRCHENENYFAEDYSETITGRLHKGASACTLLLNGKIVSLFFTSARDSEIEQVNYIFKPAENEISITDIYTLAEYRKQGLYSLLFRRAMNYYAKNGICTFVMWIMKHNRATIQAQIKLGFQEIFLTVSLFSWLGFKKTTVNASRLPLRKL